MKTKAIRALLADLPSRRLVKLERAAAAGELVFSDPRHCLLGVASGWRGYRLLEKTPIGRNAEIEFYRIGPTDWNDEVRNLIVLALVRSELKSRGPSLSIWCRIRDAFLSRIHRDRVVVRIPLQIPTTEKLQEGERCRTQ